MEILESHNLNGPESFVYSLTNQILSIWPNLKNIMDEVCLIYAGFHPTFSFFTRSSSGIKNQIIDEYNQGKRHIMFECFGEGVSRDVLVKIHNCVDELLTIYPDIKIYYLTGMKYGEKLYNDICIREHLTPYIKILSCNYFLHINSNTYPKFDIDYEISNRPKNFVCLNKVHRQHRIDLLELMLRENLINDKCYYSFHDYTHHNSIEILNMLSDDHYPNIKKNLGLIKKLQLNFDENRCNPIDIRKDDLEFFVNSYFSVVTETLYHGNNYSFTKGKNHVSDVEAGVFMTEKTTKVLSLKHPFILVSVPYMLKALKEEGYKTFHPYIDETYDTIIDDDIRLEYIISEVKRLSNQTHEEWLEWVNNVKPIVEYNYYLFFSQAVGNSDTIKT